MRSFTKKKGLGTTVLCGLMLGGCVHSVPLDKLDKRALKKVCETYCQKGTPGAEPGFALMIKTVFVNGEPEEVPMRNILARAENSEGEVTLVTPYDVTYGNHAGGDGPPMPNKAAGLKPECFAKASYTPPHINSLDLTVANTTITFVNMDQDGRLESRDLATTDQYYGLIMDVLLPQTTNPPLTLDAQKIQSLLSSIDRPTESDLQTQNNSPTRNISLLPAKKTPFFRDLTGAEFDTAEGHVFFYVLLDPNLYFSRDAAALVTYAPEAENELEKLYTPFVQYPVVPTLKSVSGEPDGQDLDVLTFHFVQSDEMMFQSSAEYEKAAAEDKIECKYIYDKLVISRGQDGYTQRTPLLIDPEVKTRGVIIE